PRRGRPCGTPGRRWPGTWGSVRWRKPHRSGRTRSGGTSRRCRACRSCGRPPGTWWCSWLPVCGWWCSLGGSRRDVGGQSVAAALAAVARLLVATEGAGRVELVEGVGPDDTGLELVGHPQDPGALLGPDAGGQAV